MHSFVQEMPALNACLNLITGGLLVTGWFMIRKRRVRLHRFLMLSAVCTSILFILSYLTYHAHVGTVHYHGTGVARNVYFVILVSHSFLAAAVVPVVAYAVIQAFRRRFERHVAVVRWLLPVWLYVCITGIVVYLMLYGLPQGWLKR